MLYLLDRMLWLYPALKMFLNNGSYITLSMHVSPVSQILHPCYPISKQDFLPCIDNWRLTFDTATIFFKSSVRKSGFVIVERLVE